MKTLVHIGAMLLLALAGVASAQPAKKAPRPYSLYTLTGQITDELGDGLPFSHVTIEGTSFKSTVDPYGSYTISNIPEGRFLIAVSANAYITQRETVEFSNPPNAMRTFRREKNFTLRYEHCQDDSARAVKDIHDHTITFPLSGIVVVPVTPEDSVFEREYGITYYDVGCTVEPEPCMLQYMRVVFAYLDHKFGSGWRSRIHPQLVSWTATIPYTK